MSAGQFHTCGRTAGTKAYCWGIIFTGATSTGTQLTPLAVPGGLADMTAMAEASGANQRTVILVQATRIVLIVFAVPLWLRVGLAHIQ